MHDDWFLLLSGHQILDPNFEEQPTTAYPRILENPRFTGNVAYIQWDIHVGKLPIGHSKD